MHLKLEGRVVLVTGSTNGIGKSIAEHFLKEGAIVYVNGRSEESVSKAIAELKQMTSSTKIHAAVGDLSSAKGCQQVIDAVPEVDILINNTGIFESVPFEKITDDEWQHFYDVNVMSSVRLSRHYLPTMLRKNDNGSVIFITSEAAYCPKGFMVHYSMTKAAQASISRGLAELTKGTSVRVNCCAPGPTWTAGVDTYINGVAKQEGKSVSEVVKDYFQTTEPSSLLQRFIKPEEVAVAVVMMASPLFSAVNGRAMLIDGGIVRCT